MNPKPADCRADVADRWRQAAYDACSAVRRMETITGEKTWYGGANATAPSWGDLEDAHCRLGALLALRGQPPVRRRRKPRPNTAYSPLPDGPE